MAAKLDPFVDVLLREHGDQLYLLPDEPVTLVKDGKPRKVSKQPLTDQHIYALLVEVAPSESANHIDQGAETEFEYVADRGMVRVRIVPEMGRLTAVVAPIEKAATRRSGCRSRSPQTATLVRDRRRAAGRSAGHTTTRRPSGRAAGGLRRPAVPGRRAGVG